MLRTLDESWREHLNEKLNQLIKRLVFLLDVTFQNLLDYEGKDIHSFKSLKA